MVVFPDSCLSSWFVVSGWLVGFVGGCDFSLKIVNFFSWVLSWLVGLSVFSVSSFFQLVGLLFRVGWGCSFSLKVVSFSVGF